MSPVASSVADRLAHDLVANLLAITPELGPNKTEWPGLTAYRFIRPQASQWAEVESLALCCVIQGRKRFVVDGAEYVCDPANYLVLSRGMRFKAEILEARSDKPYLSFVLQIDPTTVASVLGDMVEHQTASATRPTKRSAAAAAHVSPLDQEIGEVVLRFLRSLASDVERRVLAPMHLREAVFRLMLVDQVSRLLHAAGTERDRDPVTEVSQYIRQHLAEPLTVADLAKHARMSSSALTAHFVQATGMGPYQYAKRMRLNRARGLLIQNELTVSQICHEVGYTRLSHFINEFKRQFGATPGAYARIQRETVAMRVEEATSPVAVR